jgi:hypothetical protein
VFTPLSRGYTHHYLLAEGYEEMFISITCIGWLPGIDEP